MATLNPDKENYYVVSRRHKMVMVDEPRKALVPLSEVQNINIQAPRSRSLKDTVKPTVYRDGAMDDGLKSTNAVYRDGANIKEKENKTTVYRDEVNDQDKENVGPGKQAPHFQSLQPPRRPLQELLQATEKHEGKFIISHLAPESPLRPPSLTSCASPTQPRRLSTRRVQDKTKKMVLLR